MQIPNEDYSHGQMMGMLVIIAMLENARDAHVAVPGTTLEIIKKIAVGDLALYFNKPEEDVYLLIDEQLKKV